jgi:hypothetical protein
MKRAESMSLSARGVWWRGPGGAITLDNVGVCVVGTGWY